MARPRGPPPPTSPTTCPCAHAGRARTSWREHPPETCGAPVAQGDAWTPGHPDPTVSHAAQRADLPRVRPDRRRRDLGWQNRAGHHHPYHPPRALAPPRAGRGPPARTPTGDLRGTGVSACCLDPGHPDPPCATRGPARRSAAGTPRSPPAGPRTAEPRGPPPPISPTAHLCAHSGRAGTSGANTHREDLRGTGVQRDTWTTGHPDRPCATRGPARRSAADGPRWPPSGPRTAEPRGHRATITSRVASPAEKRPGDPGCPQDSPAVTPTADDRSRQHDGAARAITFSPPQQPKVAASPGWAGADESTCTPGSVPAEAGGGHPSTTYVAARLQRSTRKLGRAALKRFLSDLAPGGVYRAAPVAWGAGGLLHHRFTLTADSRRRRSAFCGTIPRVTPGGRYPPPCPVEPGRSSAGH